MSILIEALAVEKNDISQWTISQTLSTNYGAELMYLRRDAAEYQKRNIVVFNLGLSHNSLSPFSTLDISVQAIHIPR